MAHISRGARRALGSCTAPLRQFHQRSRPRDSKRSAGSPPPPGPAHARVAALLACPGLGRPGCHAQADGLMHCDNKRELLDFPLCLGLEKAGPDLQRHPERALRHRAAVFLTKTNRERSFVPPRLRPAHITRPTPNDSNSEADKLMTSA